MTFLARRSVSALVALLTLSQPAAAQERVDPIPAGPEVVVKALSPFRANPDSSRVARVLDEATADSNFPSSGYDYVLVARLWRRAGQTNLAVEWLDSVAPESAAGDLATYERARVLLEAGGPDSVGLRAFWSACASSDDRVRAELAWDLLSVSTPEESEEWATLTPGTSTCDWLRVFWNERARRMAIPTPERIALHYSRLAQARRQAWMVRPRRYLETADRHGRPPGLAFDDRGLMRVRMGDPDVWEVCGYEEDLTAECWAYYRPGGYQLFQFSTYKEALRGFSPDGDFSIQAGMPTRGPGDPWFHKYTMNADIPASVKAALVRSGGRLAVRDTAERQMDAVEAGSYGQMLEMEGRRYVSEALEEIPDVPDVESTVALRFEPLRFLNPSAGTWQVWLLASARAADLTRSTGEMGATLDVRGRFAIDPERGATDQSIGVLPTRSISVGGVGKDSGLGLRGVFTASPGPLPLTVVVEDLNAPGTGAWIQDTINIPAVGGLPQLSDIAVAQAEGGTWTRDGETFLQVSPAHITNADGSIHVYFEAYGVRPGSRYDIELRLAPVDVADRIWRLEPDDLGFRLQFATEMPGDIGRHHLRLDLSDTEPGEYTLAVRIQDEQSKAYSLPAVTDIFVAE
ncbi:MAG: hypothetical protein ACR2GQ_07865 [Gemmatimonadota bacterium]